MQGKHQVSERRAEEKTLSNATPFLHALSTIYTSSLQAPHTPIHFALSALQFLSKQRTPSSQLNLQWKCWNRHLRQRVHHLRVHMHSEPYYFSAALPLISHLKRPNKIPPPQKNCRHNPDDSLGILSAFVESAAANLRIVEPVRASARRILHVTLDLHQQPFYSTKFQGPCRFCRRWIRNGPIYVYKGEMGFCKPECRYEYIMEAKYNERQRQLAIASTPRRLRWAKPNGGIEFFI